MQYRTYINTDGVTGVDARTDRQTDRQTDGRTDGRTDRQTKKALILLGLEYFTIDFYILVYFSPLLAKVSAISQNSMFQMILIKMS